MNRPYEFELTETLENKFKKLQKKGRVLLIACRKKIFEIINNPYHYKHLKYENRFRVHVGSSFILTYRIFEEKKLVERRAHAYHLHRQHPPHNRLHLTFSCPLGAQESYFGSGSREI